MEHKGTPRQECGVLAFRGRDHLGFLPPYEPVLLCRIAFSLLSQKKMADAVFASGRSGRPSEEGERGREK